MKSIKCPVCHATILGTTPAFSQQKAIKKVLKAAWKPIHVKKLASLYASAAGCTYQSARRAIERLAKNGYLVRTKPAWYQETTYVG